LSKDAGRAETIAPGAVGTEELADESVTKAKLKKTSIQAGSASVTFPFAAAGVEDVSATISFPVAFAAPPSVVLISCNDATINVAVTSVSATGFTVTARDSEGVDYTSSVTVTIRWIAIE